MRKAERYILYALMGLSATMLPINSGCVNRRTDTRHRVGRPPAHNTPIDKAPATQSPSGDFSGFPSVTIFPNRSLMNDSGGLSPIGVPIPLLPVSDESKVPTTAANQPVAQGNSTDFAMPAIVCAGLMLGLGAVGCQVIRKSRRQV